MKNMVHILIVSNKSVDSWDFFYSRRTHRDDARGGNRIGTRI